MRRVFLPLGLGALLGALAVWAILSRGVALSLLRRGSAAVPASGEVWTLTAEDGVILRAYACPAGEDWVLLLHGWGGCAGELEALGQAYRDRGWGTLTPDLRGCGGSGGEYRGLGAGDGADVLAWMDLIRDRFPDAGIVLHGVDLGANAALAASGERPAGLLAVAADSPVPDLRERFFPGGWIMEQGVDAVLRLTAGRDLLAPSLCRQTAGTRVPVLFLHGEGDDLVPAAEAEGLYFLAGRSSRLLRLRSGHADGFRRDREAYLRGLFAFLTGCSGSPRTP